MAKTVMLNFNQTVWVTTYFGGEGHGTCFDISMQLNEETQVTRTFDLTELRRMLLENGDVRGLVKPDPD